MMGNAFYPDEWLDSAYDIPYEQFYQKGMRGIIFDIDNTLVPHGAPADERAVQLFERLRAIGFHTCLLSNNKEARVAPFAGQVGSDYIYKGRKPKRSGYRQAMRRMGTGERSTMFVGDQLFTDVYGARRTGIYSILVKPINPKEEIQIVLKRYLEKIVLWFYVRRQEKNSGSLQPGVFERFERACQAAEPDADRSAGNGGKSVVFRKNIGNFRKIRGGIDMMCPAFSKK